MSVATARSGVLTSQRSWAQLNKSPSGSLRCGSRPCIPSERDGERTNVEHARPATPTKPAVQSAAPPSHRRPTPPPLRHRPTEEMATPSHLRTLLAAALLLPLLARGDAGAIKKNETAAFFSAADPCSEKHAAGDVRPPARRGELVLVTGGSGFIGSNLVDRLLSLG
jgi:hypothetical protein